MTKVGDIGRATSLKLVPKFLDVGGYELTLPSRDPKAALLTKGAWLEFLTSDDDGIMAGQIRGIKEVEDENNVGGTLTVYGPSAEQVIADRLAYQVPTSAATNQAAAEYDRRSGVAETVIKAYVNLNAGPGALVARRTTGLSIEADNLRGSSVKGSARMMNLLELIQPLALSGGIGFRVVFSTVTGQLEFQVYVPTDKSGTAKFGMQLGNLVSYERTQEAPRSSVAVVGGQGDGTARVFRELIDSAAITLWGNRSEAFVDRRDSTDTVELDQAGTEEIVTNGPINGLAIKTMDTPRLQFYKDYNLGDKVSIPDKGVTDVLREIELSWTAEKGPSAESTVGSSSVTGTDRLIKRLNYLNRVVEMLQARK
jgi:hypothetical protein